MAAQDQWIIRTEEGKITGPFTTREILFKIKENKVDGTESISRFPGGAWTPISHNAEFYDFLLSHLSNKEALDDDQTNWNRTPDIEKVIEQVDVKDATKTIQLEVPTNEEDDRTKTLKQHSSISSDKSTPKPVKSETNKLELDFSRNILEQEEAKKEKKNHKIKASRKTKKNKINKPLLLVIVFLTIAVAIFLVFDDDRSSTAQIIFKAPINDTILDAAKVKNYADLGLENFLLDTAQGYVQAQDHFIKVLEADKSYGDIFSLLCITQHKLWPMVSNKEQSLKALIQVIKQVKQFESSSLNYFNCNNVYYLLTNENKKAQISLDNIIDRNSESNVPPTISYYLKASLLYTQARYEEAVEHSSLLESLWPEWLATSYLQLQLSLQMKDKEQSLFYLKKIIESQPESKKAAIYKGIMRNLFYQQYDDAISEISGALKKQGKVNNDLLGQAYYYLADSYIQINEIDLAKKSIEQAYRLHPVDHKIESLYVNYFGAEGAVVLSDLSYLRQGDDLMNAGDCSSAQAYYKEAIKVNKKNTEAALKAAQCLEKLNLGDEAIEILKRSLAINNKSVDVSVLLARLYVKKFMFTEAFNVINRTHKIVRGHYKLYLQFAELEFAQSNFNGAIKYADKSLEVFAGNIDAHVTKGRALYQQKQYNQAYTELVKALNIDNNHIKANTAFIKVYYEIHGVNAAINRVEKLISSQESVVEYHQVLGEVYFFDEQLLQAEQKFKQVTLIDETYQRGFIWLGDTYKLLNQVEAARGAYLRAAKIDIQNSLPQLKLGMLYLETKNYKRAKKLFKKLVDTNGNYPKAKFFYAKSLYYLGLSKEAIALLNEEKALSPNALDSYLLAAEIYEKTGQYQLCKKEYLQALKLSEFGAPFYIKASRCHRKSGSLSMASNMLDKAKSMSPNLPDVYRELGAVFEAKSDQDKALWSYQKYLQLAPNAIDAQQIQFKIQKLSR